MANIGFLQKEETSADYTVSTDWEIRYAGVSIWAVIGSGARAMRRRRSLQERALVPSAGIGVSPMRTSAGSRRHGAGRSISCATSQKVRFGGTPKSALGTSALPGVGGFAANTFIAPSGGVHLRAESAEEISLGQSEASPWVLERERRALQGRWKNLGMCQSLAKNTDHALPRNASNRNPLRHTMTVLPSWPTTPNVSGRWNPSAEMTSRKMTERANVKFCQMTRRA